MLFKFIFVNVGQMAEKFKKADKENSDMILILNA